MSNTSLTEQLQSFMIGDVTVADPLIREVLPKLREIALRELKRERYIAPLTRTELISELWVSNLGKGGWQIENRGHFFALASLAMRRILIDLARKRMATRRGGGQSAISLTGSDPSLKICADDADQIVELGLAMERLDLKDPDAARVVDMHYFSGFTLEEIACETGVTLKQVRVRWERGLKRLRKALRASPTRSPRLV